MEFTRNERRNVHIGAGVSFAVLIIALVFFHDAGKGFWEAMGIVAFFLAFVVYHALDERERRREDEREDDHDR